MSDSGFEFILEIKNHEFNSGLLNVLKENKWIKEQWPFVYILSNVQEGEAYVGETTNAFSRLGSHLSNTSRKKLNTLHLIWSDKFNKSATLDLESNLIKYLSADGRFKLQNLNAGQIGHSYHQKIAYQNIFHKVWSEFLQLGFVENPLKSIDNTDLFKYSPYKELSFDQYEAIKGILRSLLDDNTRNIFIQGSAGTGKTVLAVYLLKLLNTNIAELKAQDLEIEDKELLQLTIAIKERFKSLKMGFVVPMTSLRSTMRKVFKHVKGLDSKFVIGPSEVFNENYDFLFVDESHRLRRRKNITNFRSHDINNSRLGLGNAGTELDWVLQRSRKRVLFYDPGQSIKPSDVRIEDFNLIKSNGLETATIELTSQLRVKGGTDYISFVEKLLTTQLQDRNEIFESPTYEFYLFNSFQGMVTCLRNKEKTFGLCRLVSGYSWEWVSRQGRFDIEIEGLSFNWNGVKDDWINSDNAFNEVGCIHTTQGYDLNYTAIIFGNEITYNLEKGCIEIVRENYHDRKGREGIENSQELHDYIINIYRTLMLRGIKGTYVYVCNDSLRDYFGRHIPPAPFNY